MRMILFFDLPSVTKKEKRDYRKFIKFIKGHGFCMYQESVYTKLCLNPLIAESTLRVIKKELPSNGIVSCLTITEKQFSSIENMLGDVNTDMIINDEKMVKL